MKRVPPIVMLCLLLLSGGLYQFGFVLTPVQFVSFAVLSWQTGDDCVETVGNVGQAIFVRHLVTVRSSDKRAVSCVSQPVTPNGNYVEVEFAGTVDWKERKRAYVQLEWSDGRLIKRWQLPTTRRIATTIHRYGTSLESTQSGAVRLRVVDSATTDTQVFVRSRMNFYDMSKPIKWARETYDDAGLIVGARALFSLAAGIGIVAILSLNNIWMRVAAYFGLASVVHFRLDGFFFLDDWQYLERIAEVGWRQLLLSQNEHFIPVFSALIQLQVLLFQTHYWVYCLITLAIHGINAALIERVIVAIGGTHRCIRSIGTLFAAFYVVSGMHAEVVQWLTCSCTAWAMLARLCTYLGAINYMRRGGLRYCALTLGAGLLGPLLFGGGFAILPETACLVAVMAALRRNMPSTAVPTRSEFIRRATILGASLLVGYTLEASLYLRFHETNGVRLEEAQVPQIVAAVRYTLLGSQFGALFRGLLLSNTLRYDDLHYFGYIAPLRDLPTDLRLSLFGLLVSLPVCLCCARRHPERWHRLALCVLGQAIMMLPFILSSATRLRYGYAYAFHMRYYTVALFGVAIVLIPVAVDVFDLLEGWAKRHSFAASRVALSITCALYVWRSSQFAEQYREFQYTGQRERVFFEQVTDWNARLGRVPGRDTSFFEGHGTPLEGQQPLFFSGLPGKTSPIENPIRHPDKNWRLVNLQARHPDGN